MQFGLADVLMIFLVTIGPLKATVVYAALTADADPDFRRRVAIKTVVSATVVALVFVLAGGFLLKAFHVSLPALKIAGGLILLLYALTMVMGEGAGHDEQAAGAEPSTDIAIYPLAMPLMATPQGIVSIVTVTAAAKNAAEVMTIIGLILAIMAFNFGVLMSAHRLLRLVGEAALQVFTRVVGLLLVALAVQLMMWGLVDLGLLEPTL